MTPCKFLIIIVFLVLSANSFCQALQNFKTILTDKKIGKVFKTASYNDTTWRIYLGVLQDNSKKDKYYVIREFNKIRAASTWHGHSTVYFFDLRKKGYALVYVGMPEDLPNKLNNNTFYFEYLKDGKKKYSQSKIEVPLPKIFCSQPSGCNEIIIL